jgi:ABC-type transport system substrate-binding protein
VAYTNLLKGTPDQAVRPVNSSVVAIQLNKPFSLLGDIIGAENTPNLIPYHVWKNWINDTTAPGALFGTLVGAGPYYVSNFHQGDQQLVMLPNSYPSPWGPASNGGHPYFSKIVTQLVPSSSSLASLILGGQVDAAAIAPADVAGLLSNPNIKVAATPGTGLWYVEFTQDNYPYNLPDFRHALAYAIDTHALVQNALAGYGTVGNSAFIPQASPEFNSSVPSYSYNPNMTKQLLQNLGFKMGSDGFFTFPNGTAFQPNLYVPAEQTPIVLAGTLVAQQLQAAGINAQLRTIAGATMASIWYQGINMYFEEQNFGYPNSELLTDGSFYAYFTSQGPAQGHHAFVDPVVEKHYNDTVAALESSTTNDQIVQNEKTLQGIIATSLPSVPLFYPDFIWAYNSQKVVGWPQPPTSFEVPGGTFNITALANVYSPSALTTTSQSTGTSTGNPPSGGLDSTLIAAGIVVAALIIVGGAMLMRRQPKK